VKKGRREWEMGRWGEKIAIFDTLYLVLK